MYNLYKTPVLIDSATFSSKFKHPIASSQVKIKSETATKSDNNLFHKFTLPIAGDYIHNFALRSDYIIKEYRDLAIVVDSIGNYIENVTLCLNNRAAVISQVDAVPRIETINAYSLNEKPLIKLDFLNMPLLSKCSTETNIIIMVKFKQNPPIDYCLTYDQMLTDDNTYSDLLQREYFAVSYLSQQPMKTTKPIQLLHDHGKLILY